MKKNIRKIIPMLLLPMLFSVLLFPRQAHAEEASCSASIPVEIETAGDRIPEGEEYTVVLEAVTSGAPMPEQAVLTIKAGEKASFGPMTYTVPGDYQYRIYQEDKKAEHFTYDKAVYAMTVRVVNDPQGGLKAEVWAVKDAGKDKADQIYFKNDYKAPVDSNKPHKAHDPGGEEATNTPAQQPLLGLLTPKTGDSANLALWGGLLGVSVLGLAVLAFTRRRRQEDV